MLETKTFEIRDKGTFIPAIGIKVDITRMPFDSRDRWLMKRAGYGPDNSLVLLTRLDGGKSTHDPYDWGDRTWHSAHMYIQNSWDELESGAVIDVQYILRETSVPKLSEQQTAY